MIKISCKSTLKGRVYLPFSKSLSNRVLLIKALNNGSFTINNLSSAEDTMLMQKLLEEIKLTQQYNNSKKVFNAGNSGTVFRFLTAYCSILPGEWILDGNVRMQQRPIYHLVDALEELGVKIKYLKKIGFPPICIKGGFINKNYVAIDASISSQFISALMLIAPTIKGGLIINIKNDIASYPYIEMTSYIMDKFGVAVNYDKNFIIIPEGRYKNVDFNVEGDWTAASYYYLSIALAGGKIKLYNLVEESIQGDKIISDIFNKYGVLSHFGKNTVEIFKLSHIKSNYFEQSFINYPDIFLTIAVACAALDIKAKLTGLSNLVYKESNRLDAFCENIRKCGFDVINNSNYEIIITGNKEKPKTVPIIKTYEDHRIAMAFAPLSATLGEIIIDKPEVVLKSYPSFWNDLQGIGYEISYV